MGYTHYWDILGNGKTLASSELAPIAADFRRLLPRFETLGITLGDGMGALGSSPYIEGLRFNGQGAEGHETFALDNGSGFCKTNRKGYDTAVCCALIIALHKLGPERFRVTTDGRVTDWEEPLELCDDVLGYGSEYRVTVGGLLVRKDEVTQ